MIIKRSYREIEEIGHDCLGSTESKLPISLPTKFETDHNESKRKKRLDKTDYIKVSVSNKRIFIKMSTTTGRESINAELERLH